MVAAFDQFSVVVYVEGQPVLLTVSPLQEVEAAETVECHNLEMHILEVLTRPTSAPLSVSPAPQINSTQESDGGFVFLYGLQRDCVRCGKPVAVPTKENPRSTALCLECWLLYDGRG